VHNRMLIIMQACTALSVNSMYYSYVATVVLRLHESYERTVFMKISIRVKLSHAERRNAVQFKFKACVRCRMTC
jgi:hypothetical protein